MTTTVACDNCETRLYQACVLPTVSGPGTSPRTEFFTALPGIPQPRAGDPFDCPACGAHLIWKEPDLVWMN